MGEKQLGQNLSSTSGHTHCASHSWGWHLCSSTAGHCSAGSSAAGQLPKNKAEVGLCEPGSSLAGFWHSLQVSTIQRRQCPEKPRSRCCCWFCKASSCCVIRDFCVLPSLCQMRLQTIPQPALCLCPSGSLWGAAAAGQGWLCHPELASQPQV